MVVVIPSVGTEDNSVEKERLRLAEEETRRRIEIRLKEKQDGEQKQQQQPQPLKPSDVAESDLTPNKEGILMEYCLLEAPSSVLLLLCKLYLIVQSIYLQLVVKKLGQIWQLLINSPSFICQPYLP